MNSQLKIARAILGKQKFIEIYGVENLPNLKIEITLRHDRNRKQFERVFPISENCVFEGYSSSDLSYPTYLIDRYTWIENKDKLTKSVTITNIKPVNNE